MIECEFDKTIHVCSIIFVGKKVKVCEDKFIAIELLTNR